MNKECAPSQLICTNLCLLPSSASTQLNSTSTQTKAEVSLISSFRQANQPPTRKINGKIQLKPSEYLKSLKTAFENCSDNSNCMTIVIETFAKATVGQSKFGPSSALTQCNSNYG